MNDEQVKQKFIEETQSQLANKKWLAIGAGIVLLAVFSSIAVAALTAGLALTALAGIGLGLTVSSIYVYKRFPLWVQQMENNVIEARQKEMLSHLESMKKTAKLNPIEQMEATYMMKKRKLSEFSSAVIALKASVDKQQRKLKDIKKEKPHFDMSEEEAQTKKMESYVVLKETQLRKASATLADFKDNIDQIKVKWEFQLEANEAIKAMNTSDKESMMAELLTDTAFEQVHTSFDKIFAQMELEMNDINIRLNETTPLSISAPKSNLQGKYEADYIEAEVTYGRA